MKDLDPTKIYNLEKLNTKQFLTLLRRVNLDSSRFIGMENPCVVFYNDLWNAAEETMLCEESVYAIELFEERVMKIKDLDRSKVYDISKLNLEQKEAVFNWLQRNENGWEWATKEAISSFIGYCLFYDKSIEHWDCCLNKDTNITNALELFEEEEDNHNMSISWSNIDVKYERV